MKRTILYSLIVSLVLGQVAFAFPGRAFADPGDTLRIHATPPSPAAFQRVFFAIDLPTYTVGNTTRTEDPDFGGLSITWLVNGEKVDACQDSTFCSFMTGAAGDRFDPNNTHSYLVHVTYVGENQTYGGTIKITPLLRDVGQRDNFTGALDCQAQQLDALANNIDRMSMMLDDTVNQIDMMAEQLTEDLDFLVSFLDFEAQFQSIIDSYEGFMDSIAAIGNSDGTVQGYLRTAARALRAFIRAYRMSDISQKIEHFRKIKKRYENMGKTLDAMKKAKIRYTKNMVDQNNRTLALCNKMWSRVDTHGL